MLCLYTLEASFIVNLVSIMIDLASVNFDEDNSVFRIFSYGISIILLIVYLVEMYICLKVVSDVNF